ncbi:hypothetical protein DPMN_032537 [Dreissena polymorpha]|uniref:Uncharacterized protein n=1 Tax=Dreissena polymorpha TaxID=45954 RepID=A0A9D4M448_DREPO|nr:hypothetical protein DPMN_032537 [Dreissena polymorpha]
MIGQNNVTSRVKKTPPLGGHETNVLTKFHEDWAKNKTATPPGGHVFPPIMTIFELTKFHDGYAKNVYSRVFTSFFYYIRKMTPPWRPYWNKNVTSRVFTYFHFIHIEKTAPPPGDHVFSLIWTIFKLVQDTNETNVFTKFHDDWAKFLTPRVFTRNTAPPPGSHTNILTNFELSRGIIETNVLTKFHEDRTRNVASRVFTRQNVDDERRTDDGQRRSQKLTMSMLCSGELKI